MSKEDRRHMERLARSLRAIEQEDPGDPEARRALLRLVNARRVADGADPLPDEDETRPEEALYRRARSLGMARTDR